MKYLENANRVEIGKTYVSGKDMSMQIEARDLL
jgi:hypothetical protein